MLKNFDEVVERVQKSPIRKKCVVVAADEHAIEASLEADKEGLADPVFVGDEALIKNVLKGLNSTKDYKIVPASSLEEAASIGVSLARNEEVDFIIKGAIDTSILLKAVVNKETGLGTGRLMTHVSFNEVSTYHKLIVTTDGGMVTYPDVEKKQGIIENAVHVLKSLGYEKPKVAVLAAVEKVNPKMPETLDAAELKQRNIDGKIKDCIVEGPISFDLAWFKEAAHLKGYKSEVAGDADVLLVPNITAGNILGKSLVYAANGKMAGLVVGAKVPIILTSRSSSSQEKFLSIALAALVDNKL